MLGTLVTVGISALAFKLGMDSQQMFSKGKSTSEVVSSLPGNAVQTVASAVMSCYNSVAGLFKGDKSPDSRAETKNENA